MNKRASLSFVNFEWDWRESSGTECRIGEIKFASNINLLLISFLETNDSSSSVFA